MAWRRGELWLETDVLWLGEAAGSPALAGFASVPVPSPAPPPGLAASRRRRAEWERRRHARRARATAIVLSPAVIVPLALLRSGYGRESRVVVEDPPSLTIRLSAENLEAHVGVAPRLPVTSKRERSRRRVARPDASAKIEWHHARSFGLPWSGSLIDGTQLPIEGPSWVTWNPVTDRVPNEPKRLYGNERTIRAIVAVTHAYRAAHPRAPRVVIGDISREGGGPMADEHVSHQNGLDVDVYFPRRDRALRAPRAPAQIDHRLAQDLVDRFVAAGAQMIFVGYASGLHGPNGIVIPYAGHEYHMHVRFPPTR
jgi:hypothetical protein